MMLEYTVRIFLMMRTKRYFFLKRARLVGTFDVPQAEIYEENKLLGRRNQVTY
jgi:hypothetical protein